MKRLRLAFCAFLFLTACSRKPDANTLVMIIESTPANLDPRIGTDAWSERIDMLIFDSLVLAMSTSICSPAWRRAGRFPIR